jgi:hypothetical protein
MGWIHFAYENTDVLCVQDMLPLQFTRRNSLAYERKPTCGCGSKQDAAITAWCAQSRSYYRCLPRPEAAKSTVDHYMPPEDASGIQKT